MTKQIPPVKQEYSDYTQREVLRVAWIIFGVIAVGMIAAIVLITLGSRWAMATRQGLVFIWSGLLPFALVAVWLARRGQSSWAARTLIGGLALAMLLTELRVAGFGLVLAGTLVILTASIVAQIRLPSSRPGHLILAAVVVGLLILALDLYAPGTREIVTPQIALLINVLAVALAGITGLLALRHWGQFRLPTKLILGFIAVTLASVVAVSVVSNLVVSGALSNQVGSSLKTLALNEAGLVGSKLDREQDLILQLASSDLLRLATIVVNTSYPREQVELDAHIRELNRQWKRSALGDPFVQQVLSNSSALQLLHFRTNFPENLQILLTDRYGNLVAATNLVDSYFQGDQEWWIKAYNSGKGATFISQPRFDPTLNKMGIVFALPLYEPGTSNAVGVVQAVYSMEGLTQQLSLSSLGTTGASDLVFPSGQVLRANGNLEFLNEQDSNALRSLTTVDYANIVYDGNPVLASHAIWNANAGNSPTQPTALNWMVVVHQSPAEALQPVDQATQAALLSGIGSLLLAGLLALVAATFFTRPITRLTSVAERVAEGDLTVRAAIDSEDEVGILATTFNRMTGRLRQTLETLEQRVADRTADLARAGEELEHRANNLETSAEIARAAASTLNLDDLLPLVTRLLGERFGFSHVGVYLLDPTRTDAVLRASYSASGQAAREIGEKVQVGSNTFVGSVTAKGERRLAQDVSWDSLYPQSPQLIGTRSELTLPLVEGGQTVGALDVHRAQGGGFIASDVTALTSLADQISIAIQNARSFDRQVTLAEENRRSMQVQAALAEENKRSAERAAALAEESQRSAERAEALAEENRQAAERQAALAGENRVAAERQAALADENRRLFERAQQAVQELDSLTRRLTGEGWDQYLDTLAQEVLVQDAAPELGDAQPAFDPLDRARNAAKVVTATNGHSTVALPILLRGEVIGSMALEDSDPERKWSEDEISLAQEVSERLALALDNARLYSESQRELGERKRAEEQVRRQNTYLSALADITVGLIQRLDSQALVETILQRASELTGTRNGYVYLLDRTTNAMVMSLGTGTYARLIGQKTAPGRGLAGTVWQTGEPLVLDDYRTWPQRLQASGRDDIRAVLGIPLKSGEQVIGVLGLAHLEEGRKFDAAEIDVLARLSQLASIALDNANLFKETQTNLVWQETLYRVAERVGSATTVEEVVEGASELLAPLGLTSAALAVIKEEDAQGTPIRTDLHVRVLQADGKMFAVPTQFGIPIPGMPGDPLYYEKLRITVHPNLDDMSTTYPPDHSRPVAVQQLLLGRGLHGAVTVGLGGLGRKLGFLTLSRPTPLDRPPEEYIERVRVVVDEIAKALDNLNLVEGIQQELAERKRTEAELRQAQQFLDSVIESLPMMLFAKEAKELRFVRWNKAGEELMGFARQEMVGKNDFDLVTGEQAEFFTGKDRQVLNGKQLVDIPEEAIQTRDKGIRYLHTRKIPILDDKGEPRYLLGISEDITERKRAEQALTAERNLVNMLMDNVPDAIYFKDRDSRFLRVNRAFGQRYASGDPEALIGKSDFDLFTEEHARPAYEDEQEIIRTGKLLQGKEEKETYADGHVNWVSTTKLPLRSPEGEIVGTAGITRDITERKRFEQALAESEAFYHNLVELLPENLCMKDLEGRFTFVNQRYCEDAKLTREEIIGKSDYDLHPKELADKYRADDMQIIRTGDMIDTVEAHQTLTGERTYVHTVKSPTRDASGRITGVQIIFWDVTEQMRTQEKIRQQNEYFVAMHDMSLAMIGRHDVNELLTDIVEHAGTLVGTEHGYVYLFDRATDQIEMRVGVGIYNEFVGSFARRGQGLAGTAWQSGEPVTVDDYRDWPGRLPHPSRDKLRAVVGVPLQSGDQTIGVMGLAFLEEGRRFGPNEIDVLSRFAQLAAIALDNAQLFQDSQKRLNELGSLNRISQALTSQLDFDTLTYTIGEHLREIFDVQSVYLALYDRAKNQISFPYFLSDGKAMNIDSIAFGEGLTSQIIQTREPLFLNQDMDRHAQQYRARVVGSPAQSYLGVPILIGSEAIGVLSIQSIRRTHSFSEDDLRLLTTISAGVGVALQNARLFKEAQDRAQREFQTREIVARVSRSINQDTILQTTARQLGHALGSSHVVIRLKGTATGNGNGNGESRS